MKTTVTRALQAARAAAAGLLLAGCSATHIGESWQCPLAQGASCTSIAEADPAVPARAAVLFGEPLRGAPPQVGRSRAQGRGEMEEACDSGCGLLAWFRGWLASGTDDRLIRATSAATGPAVGQDAGAPTAVPAADASLRVPEVLGRIWIAPFVDADGIYREAHWVRVVLEPADWRLP